MAVYHAGVALELVLAAVAAFVLVFVSAPYGRHTRRGWGPVLPARLAWVLMEAPAVLLFARFYASGAHASQTVPLYFFAMWQVHYVHRTFIFPFRAQSQGKTVPLSIAALAFGFNCLNAWINAIWVGSLATYPDDWMLHATTWIGTLLFFVGLLTNIWSDTVLMRLRRDGHTGYHVPRGGLYELVSCPNYLGELIEWLGWAIATWSTAGLAFFLFTAANLLPRAITNHAWYKHTFPDYPEDRKAVIPFVV
ncbi:MAG: DUF1295 domain-containing protein [Alphaproteobacteria bacterium]|nr:DUF1295 domain-containing protein [Alphaproteobacteria bacterium]